MSMQPLATGRYRHRRTAAALRPALLQEGLETATGELIAIFDADFIPPADFLPRDRPFLYGPAGRCGSNPVDLSEQGVQHPYSS